MTRGTAAPRGGTMHLTNGDITADLLAQIGAFCVMGTVDG